MKKVLLTHSEPSVSKLVEIFKESGVLAEKFPLLDIVYLSSVEIKKSISSQSKDAGIFVSQHAVRAVYKAFGKRFLDHYETIFAIGEDTAQCLRQCFNVAAIYPDIADSEHFVDLSNFQVVKDKSFDIFRAQDGRELIATVLQDRGALVSYVSCYERNSVSLRL